MSRLASIIAHRKTRHSAACELLTPDKRRELAELWKDFSEDLFNRDGSDPAHPEQKIRNNEKLVAAIQLTHEKLVSALAERYAPRDYPRRIQSKQGLAWKDARSWDGEWIQRCVERGCRRIDRIVNDRTVSEQIMGSVIGRTLDAFNATFPELGEATISNNTLARRRPQPRALQQKSNIFPQYSKRCLKMLTPDKRIALEAHWHKESRSLYVRDGNDPEYPGQNFKDDPKLQALAYQIFQNYICFFIEEGLAIKNPHLPEEKRTRLSVIHASWAKHRYTVLALGTLNRHTQDPEASIGILGSVIRRAIDAFNGTFPELPQGAVLNEAVLKRSKYLISPPDEITR